MKRRLHVNIHRLPLYCKCTIHVSTCAHAHTHLNTHTITLNREINTVGCHQRGFLCLFGTVETLHAPSGECICFCRPHCPVSLVEQFKRASSCSVAPVCSRTHTRSLAHCGGSTQVFCLRELLWCVI